MVDEDGPSRSDAGDELAAALADLDAAEAAELDALGRAIGVALSVPASVPLDPVKVDELWSRVEPEL